MESACRWLKVVSTLKDICSAFNSAGMVFFAYMTIKFCTPLTEHWQEFMLVYQANLDQLAKISNNIRKHGHAKKSNKAVADANNQIVLMQAFIEGT